MDEFDKRGWAALTLIDAALMALAIVAVESLAAGQLVVSVIPAVPVLGGVVLAYLQVRMGAHRRLWAWHIDMETNTEGYKYG